MSKRQLDELTTAQARCLLRHAGLTTLDEGMYLWLPVVASLVGTRIA